MRMRQSTSLILLGLLWLGLAVLGTVTLTTYSSKAGEKGRLSERWPKASALDRSKAKPNLLVFLHPECSCSKATVGELDRVLARVKRPVATTVIFIRPRGWSDEQLKGSLWRASTRIPNVKLEIDETGEEAKRFGALTSGHTTLYDAKGELVFAGGLTGARGHEGDNLGEDSVERILATGTSPTDQSDVYGCELFDGTPFSSLSRTVARFL